jgi:hypothetical protein
MDIIQKPTCIISWPTSVTVEMHSQKMFLTERYDWQWKETSLAASAA